MEAALDSGEYLEHLENDEELVETVEDNPGERVRRPPSWLKGYVSVAEIDDLHNHEVIIQSQYPETYNDAVMHAKWRKAMNVELKAIYTKEWNLGDN